MFSMRLILCRLGLCFSPPYQNLLAAVVSEIVLPFPFHYNVVFDVAGSFLFLLPFRERELIFLAKHLNLMLLVRLVVVDCWLFHLCQLFRCYHALNHNDMEYWVLQSKN